MSENGTKFIVTLRQFAALWPQDQPWDFGKAVTYIAADLRVDLPLDDGVFMQQMLALKQQTREEIVAVR